MKIEFKGNDLFQLAPYWVQAHMPAWIGKTVQQTLSCDNGVFTLTLELQEGDEKEEKK